MVLSLGNGSGERSPSGSDETEARERRRTARLSWPLRRFDLGAEPGDDLNAQTTGDERLAMVWPLTLLSWRLSGRSIPGYERSQAPGRIVRSDRLR